MSSEQVIKAYKVRWRIEIIFKSWKTHFKLGICASISNTFFAEIIMYVKLINICIFNAFILMSLFRNDNENKNSNISLLKTTGCVLKLSKLPVRVDGKFCYKLINYFGCYEKRNDRLNFFQLIS